MINERRIVINLVAVLSGILLEGLNKTTKNIRHDRRSPEPSSSRIRVKSITARPIRKVTRVLAGSLTRSGPLVDLGTASHISAEEASVVPQCDAPAANAIHT
jgi:hypothetical protein